MAGDATVGAAAGTGTATACMCCGEGMRSSLGGTSFAPHVGRAQSVLSSSITGGGKHTGLYPKNGAPCTPGNALDTALLEVLLLRGCAGPDQGGPAPPVGPSDVAVTCGPGTAPGSTGGLTAFAGETGAWPAHVCAYVYVCAPTCVHECVRVRACVYTRRISLCCYTPTVTGKLLHTPGDAFALVSFADHAKGRACWTKESGS